MMANRIILLANHIAETQSWIALGNTGPLQGGVEQSEAEPTTLTDQQREEMAALIKQYGIRAWQDENDESRFYVSHSSRPGLATAFNEVEIYEIVQDITSELSGVPTNHR